MKRRNQNCCFEFLLILKWNSRLKCCCDDALILRTNNNEQFSNFDE